jgi:hypothetical protein
MWREPPSQARIDGEANRKTGLGCCLWQVPARFFGRAAKAKEMRYIVEPRSLNRDA